MIWHSKSFTKFYTKIVQICPPHLSDVATVPWEIQQKYIQKHYLYVRLRLVVLGRGSATTMLWNLCLRLIVFMLVRHRNMLIRFLT